EHRVAILTGLDEQHLLGLPGFDALPGPDLIGHDQLAIRNLVEEQHAALLREFDPVDVLLAQIGPVEVAREDPLRALVGQQHAEPPLHAADPRRRLGQRAQLGDRRLEHIAGLVVERVPEGGPIEWKYIFVQCLEVTLGEHRAQLLETAGRSASIEYLDLLLQCARHFIGILARSGDHAIIDHGGFSLEVINAQIVIFAPLRPGLVSWGIVPPRSEALPQWPTPNIVAVSDPGRARAAIEQIVGRRPEALAIAFDLRDSVGNRLRAGDDARRARLEALAIAVPPAEAADRDQSTVLLLERGLLGDPATELPRLLAPLSAAERPPYLVFADAHRALT